MPRVLPVLYFWWVYIILLFLQLCFEKCEAFGGAGPLECGWCVFPAPSTREALATVAGVPGAHPVHAGLSRRGFALTQECLMAPPTGCALSR